MEARETKIQPLIEGSKQFLLPLFQRKYVWDKPQWESLLKDIIQLHEEDDATSSHFIGSIVTIPMNSVPQGVSKFVLIDGQQRLTTLFVLLTVLRDKAKLEDPEDSISEKINSLLVNVYEKNLDHYKLIPTEKENDRKIFINLIKKEDDNLENQIKKAYQFFDRELRKVNISIKELFSVITLKLSLVSIVLHENDNPNLVFESLNSTGIKLLPSDLIRNYFFMRIHSDKQTQLYEKYWLPMEEKLTDKELTEFVRHYIKKDGTIVKASDSYFKLRERINVDNAEQELQLLAKYANFYHKLLHPINETEPKIKKYLQRLNVLEVTTVYPFLLNCYNDHIEKKISTDEFVQVLQIIENYLIRRYIANVPTNQLDKIFPPLYNQINIENGFTVGLKVALSKKNYPTDIQLRKAIESAKLYGGGDKVRKTKHLLFLIEQSYGHKEQVNSDSLTIEHVLPQTVSEDWKKHLGDTWEETQDLYLHTLGNLTLTGYNSELNNMTFDKKKVRLLESNLELNKYFADKTQWKQEDIIQRSEYLTNKCLEIWTYFGEETQQPMLDTTGTKPVKLVIWEQEYSVKYWVDVLEQTIKTIADLDPEKLEMLIKQYPRFVSKQDNKFRRPLEVVNGVFVEKNFSSDAIQKFCIQAIESIELTSDDWQVVYA